jgi:hypothetical protein
MSIIESKHKGVWAAVVLAALVALPAAAAEPAPAPQAAVLNATPGSLNWTPNVTFDKLVLSVSGGGFTKTEEFTGGAPHFTPVDNEGYLLPDGNYTWQLTVIPRALDANDSHFRSSVPSADGRAMKAAEAPGGLTQTGSFTISGGAIADPNLAEGPSARAAEQSNAGADIDDSDAANQ